jgi:hypothetical protein
MIKDRSLQKANPEALARLFCWLTFRPMHLSDSERALLGRVRTAMGAPSVRMVPSAMKPQTIEVSFWEYSD